MWPLVNQMDNTLSLDNFRLSFKEKIVKICPPGRWFGMGKSKQCSCAGDDSLLSRKENSRSLAYTTLQHQHAFGL